MQFHQRLIRGLLSSFAARSVAIVGQLVTVPLLARTWGVQVYGQYLTMVAMTAYIGMVTLGAHQAVLSEMSVAYARNDDTGFSNALRGLFQAILALSVVCLGTQFVLAFATPATVLLHQHVGQSYSARWAIFLIGVQVILQQNLGVTTNGIGATGRYGESQAWDTVRTAIDSVGLWIGVLGFGFLPDRAALVSVCITLLACVLACVRLHAVEPDKVRLWGRVDWRAILPLWRPIIGNFAIGNGFQLMVVQAPRLILASVAGPAAVALFSIIWTLMGLVRQSFEIAVHPLTVEFAFAFGGGDQRRATKMLALGTTVATGITALACPPVIVAGPWIIALVTKGEVAAPMGLMAMLWAVLAIYSASICFQTALLAVNEFHRVLSSSALVAAAYVALAFGLGRADGVYGVAAALIFFQLGLTAVMIRATCRVFGLGLKELIGQMMDIPTAVKALWSATGLRLRRA